MISARIPSWDAFIDYSNEFVDSLFIPATSPARVSSAELTDQLLYVREVSIEALGRCPEGIREVIEALP
jgi:hypothetical protein